MSPSLIGRCGGSVPETEVLVTDGINAGAGTPFTMTHADGDLLVDTSTGPPFYSMFPGKEGYYTASWWVIAPNQASGVQLEINLNFLGSLLGQGMYNSGNFDGSNDLKVGVSMAATARLSDVGTFFTLYGIGGAVEVVGNLFLTRWRALD